MLVFDASAVIHGWDNYPIDQFPKVWIWMAALIEKEECVIPHAAYGEIEHVAVECWTWLKNEDVTVITPNTEILQRALSLANALGIQNDNYHAKGVDENDLTIIATAMANGCGVISNEAKQPQLPPQLPKYKIPAVCQHIAGVQSCMSFVELVKASKVVF